MWSGDYASNSSALFMEDKFWYILVILGPATSCGWVFYPSLFSCLLLYKIAGRGHIIRPSKMRLDAIQLQLLMSSLVTTKWRWAEYHFDWQPNLRPAGSEKRLGASLSNRQMMPSGASRKCAPSLLLRNCLERRSTSSTTRSDSRSR